MADPALFEPITLVDELSGRFGSNRSPAHRNLISAETDHDAVLAWLTRFADQPNTLASGRREVERLLLWCLADLRKPLSSMTAEHLLKYQRFLSDPQPTDRWIARGRVWPRHHPDWRPFSGALSPASQRQAMSVINSLFSWLVEVGYLRENPMGATERGRTDPVSGIERFLPPDLWAEVRITISGMPRTRAMQRRAVTRTLWLFTLVHVCELGLTEVITNTMGGFLLRSEQGKEPSWWLKIVGHNGQTRYSQATEELIAELVRYRQELGLSDTPNIGELSPLLFPAAWRAEGNKSAPIDWPCPLTKGAIHSVLKGVLAETVARLQSEGSGREPQIARLLAASAHWLRPIHAV